MSGSNDLASNVESNLYLATQEISMMSIGCRQPRNDEDVEAAEAQGGTTSSTPDAPSAGSPVSTSQVLALIQGLGDGEEVGNVKALWDAASLVLRFLEEGKSANEDEQEEAMISKVAFLWICPDFLRFLLKCFTTSSVTNLSLHLTALKILEDVMVYSRIEEDLEIIERENLCHVLLYLLKSPSPAISEQAATSIDTARVAEISEPVLRSQLISHATYIFTFLRYLLTPSPNLTGNRAVSSNLVKSTARIIRGIFVTPEGMDAVLMDKINEYYNEHHPGDLDDINAHLETPIPKVKVLDAILNANPDLEHHFPSVAAVQAALPVMRVLLDQDDSQVLYDVLCGISICLRLFIRPKEFVNAGVSDKLITLLNCSDDAWVLSLVAIVIGQLVTDPEDLILFLKATAHGGLENYWKVLKCLVLDAACILTEELKKNISALLQAMAILITNAAADGNQMSANLVVESGVFCWLPFCFENKLPSETKYHALTLIHFILKYLSPKRTREIFGSGRISMAGILEVLKSSQGRHAVGAQVIMQLVDSCPSRRDEAISLDVISTLLICLNWWESLEDEEPVTYIMGVIAKLIEIKPSAPLEAFQEIPAAFQRYWEGIPASTKRTEEQIALPMEILAAITSYGVEGVELVAGQVELLPKIMGYLSSKNERFQGAAMRTIFQVCKGARAHRLGLLDEGLLMKFVPVLQFGSVANRKMAIECLYCFLNERILNFDQKIFLREKLGPLIQAEVKRDNPETYLLSGYVNEGIREMFLARNRNT